MPNNDEIFNDLLRENSHKVENGEIILIEDYSSVDYKKDISLLIESFEKKFLEREHLSRVFLLALFAEVNILLIGKPGTAKTAFSQAVTSIVKSSSFWEKQLSKESKLKEIIGDNIESENSIVNAHYLYFDELYKGNTDTLNGTLSLLNEGYITVDGQQLKCNIRLAFASSNELPNMSTMEAFVDRIPITIQVDRIRQKENKKKFIRKDFDRTKDFPRYFVFDEIDYIKEQSLKVEVSDEFEDKYIELMTKTEAEGLRCSDRKYGKAIELLKVSAFLNNRNYLDFSDIFLMKDVAYSDFQEQINLNRILYELMFGNKVEIEDILKKVEQESTKLMSIMSSDYKSFLDYSQKLEGRQKELIFQQVYSSIDTLMNNYNIQLDSLQDVTKRYYQIIDIEKKINENIFLLTIKNNVFTNDVLKKLFYLIESVTESRDICETWLIDNPNLYAYEVNTD